MLINDLKRHHESLQTEIQAAMNRVLASGWYILGPEVTAFETEFAVYCGSATCVSVANGTDALEIALRGVGVQPGDQVITVANAGMYATTALLSLGAVPVYAEIDPATLLLDLNQLPDRLNPHIRAVIVTHLYGSMVDMERVLAIVGPFGIPVIEDCAQAHGAQVANRKAGTWGTAGCFSFYPTKNLGALGDGGAIITSDPGLAQRVRSLRQYGWTTKYQATHPGGRNSRLDELQAAILRVKLPWLDGWNARRRAIARFYSAALAGFELGLPGQAVGWEQTIAHLFVVTSPHRNALREKLTGLGIGTDIHYPIPDYRQAAVEARFGARFEPLPVTETACATVLTLPCFPEMTDAEVESTATLVKQGMEALARP